MQIWLYINNNINKYNLILGGDLFHRDISSFGVSDTHIQPLNKYKKYTVFMLFLNKLKIECEMIAI